MTTLPAVLPIEQDIPPSRADETDALRIRRRMARDVADLAALNGGVTRDEMIGLGWTNGQLVTHLAGAIRLATADAPPADVLRPTKRIRRGASPPALRPGAGFGPASQARTAARAIPLALMALCFALASLLTLATRPGATLRAGAHVSAAAFSETRTRLPAAPPSRGAQACAEPARGATPLLRNVADDARGLQFANLSGDQT